MRLTGAEDLAPIRVVLAPESSVLAREVPLWISGYATGPAGRVVLFPARTRKYPDDDFDALVQHEVAHVLIDRAAAGRPVPRWFHEGLAMAAGRGRGLEDRSRTAWAILIDGRTTLAELDSRFVGASAEVQAAYALAGDFVADLLVRQGPEVAPRILAGISQGEDFETAFVEAVGEPLASVEASYWRRRTLWNRWVPLLTSSTALWFGITALALVAFKKRKERDRKLKEAWALEDDLAALRAEAAPEPPDDEDPLEEDDEVLDVRREPKEWIN